MYDAFEFDYDERFKNHLIGLKWDINIDNDGNETCKKLIIVRKFENANKEYLAYCCELKRLFQPKGITEFLPHEEEEVVDGKIGIYHSAKLGKGIFKIFTQEEIDLDFMESIIHFLIKHCPDAPKPNHRPNSPKP